MAAAHISAVILGEQGLVSPGSIRVEPELDRAVFHLEGLVVLHRHVLTAVVVKLRGCLSIEGDSWPGVVQINAAAEIDAVLWCA